MFKKIVTKIRKIRNKKILLIPTEKTKLPLNTAAKSSFGFWYTGNVFNKSDIAYGIAYNGEVETNETKLFIETLKELIKIKEKINVFDVGANTGYYGILSAYLFKNNCNVFSFEPLEEHVMCLKETIKINGLNNITVFELGLGEEKAKIEMSIAGSGSTLVKDFISPDQKNKYPTKTISIESLDRLFSLKKIPEPHFIKIDVEGFEYSVLKGANNLLKISSPILFIEIVEKRDRFINNKYQETFTFLENLGYASYILNGEKLEKFDREKHYDGINMFLFVPKKITAVINSVETRKKHG